MFHRTMLIKLVGELKCDLDIIIKILLSQLVLLNEVFVHRKGSVGFWLGSSSFFFFSPLPSSSNDTF